MDQIDPATSIGALVAERPARARLFERLRIDYCCGGGQTLAEACANRGLHPDTVARLLQALDTAPPDRGWPLEDMDWRKASIGELCQHIVWAHHEGLRRDLPRIAELAATVERVHGRGHGELRDLARMFAGMRSELERHLDLEERVLFPACVALERDGAPLDQGVLALLEDDHADTGDALVAMRELAADYDTGRALCGTHRALLEALRRLELDLHQHVHEENNILFPRVRALAAATARTPSHARNRAP
jgi:regulator of cell morphogenesis and NO signaling